MCIPWKTRGKQLFKCPDFFGMLIIPFWEQQLCAAFPPATSHARGRCFSFSRRRVEEGGTWWWDVERHHAVLCGRAFYVREWPDVLGWSQSSVPGGVGHFRLGWRAWCCARASTDWGPGAHDRVGRLFAVHGRARRLHNALKRRPVLSRRVRKSSWGTACKTGVGSR